jgi:hypothetical protein
MTEQIAARLRRRLLAIWRSCYRLIEVSARLSTHRIPEWRRVRRAVRTGSLAGLLAFACCGLVSTRAFARDATYRMALLELESDNVHDKFAGLLTQRLRAALSDRSGYELQYAPVSLAQLSLAHDCDTSKADCLATIARELKLDGFVFGKVTHEGGAPVALLRRYDLRSGSVDRSALVTFASLDVEQDELERGAEQLLAGLLGGDTAASAHSQPSAAQPAKAVAASTPVTKPATALSGRTVATYSLLAGSVLSAGMAVASFIWVNDAGHNTNFKSYRLAVGDSNPSVRDVCSEAAAGKDYGLDAASFRQVKSSCSSGTTFEVLQYVFIASAVVAGGFAAYLLASDDSTSEQPRRTSRSLSLRPNVGRRDFGVSARLIF